MRRKVSGEELLVGIVGHHRVRGLLEMVVMEGSGRRRDGTILLLLLLLHLLVMQLHLMMVMKLLLLEMVELLGMWRYHRVDVGAHPRHPQAPTVHHRLLVSYHHASATHHAGCGSTAYNTHHAPGVLLHALRTSRRVNVSSGGVHMAPRCVHHAVVRGLIPTGSVRVWSWNATTARGVRGGRP